MLAGELRKKDMAELRKELTDLRKAQFNLRIQAGSGQAIRSHEIKTIRKDIARVKTVMSELKASA